MTNRSIRQSSSPGPLQKTLPSRIPVAGQPVLHPIRPTTLQLVVTLVLVVCGVMEPTGTAEAIEVVDTRWGFDGTARSETFVPLYVLVRNDTPDQFTGQFTLNKHDALGGAKGAPLIQVVVLAPQQQNWIRFPVYLESGDVVDGNGQSTWNWRLRWSDKSRRQTGGYRLETPPRRGPPAKVLLLSRGDVEAGGSFGLSVLNDELFPASVTTCDALGMVFLDHVPRWQNSQRRAFIDWIRRGGRVHVLHDTTGRYPRFPTSLGILNQSPDATPPLPPRPNHGSGEIRFHPRGRSDIDASFVATVSARRVSPKTSNEEKALDPVFNGLSSSSDMSFFTRFKQMTTPDHNWLIIFALAGLYWLLLFPGGLLLGLKRIDYRIVLGSILATILVFSLGFSWIGARAYDEATVVNSLATARHLGGDRWDVQQWSALFVIDGDTYTISHTRPDASAGPAIGGQLFAVPGSTEKIPGSIVNGFNGRFRVAIAPYTLRPFVHRIAATGPQWNPQVIEWRLGKRNPIAIKIQLSPSKDTPSVRSAWVQYGSQLLRLTPGSGTDGNVTLVHATGGGRMVDSLARPQDNFSLPRGGIFGTNPKQPVDKVYEGLIDPLLSRTLRWIDPAVKAEPLRPDRLRLFLLTNLPKTFHIKQPQRTGHAGRALFVQDVTAPARAGTAQSALQEHTPPRPSGRADIAVRAGSQR